MLVVGSRGSANTLRLAKIARECSPNTQHVETEQDIDWAPLSRCETIGVTAGASTPRWMIRRVVDHLHFLAQHGKGTPRSLISRAFDLFSHVNIFLALGAAALYYASCTLQGFAFRPLGSLLVFLYFLSMYLWNSLGSIEMTQHLGLLRYRFYQAHKGLLYGIAVASIAVLLAASYVQGNMLFALMLVCTLGGLAYHLTIVPRFLRPFVRYGNLRDIPTSRDLFVALAWGIVITFVPHAMEQVLSLTTASALTLVWIFALAYLRSVILDLRDIESDRIMGRETLVTIVGERLARRAALVGMRMMTAVVLVYLLVSLLVARQPAPEGIAFALQLPVLLYVYFLDRRNRAWPIRRASLFAALVDAQFLLCGLLAYITSLLPVWRLQW
jgi:4-hydroxy-3-methylbut-2-enyl diphosphate reductase